MDGVPFFDLKSVHAPLRAEIDAALRGVIDRGDFILGAELARFEEDFARHCGTRHAVGVASGLDALTLALEAAGIGPGDEVVTAANSFVATAFAISRAGAVPVLADCEESTFNL